MSSIPNQFNCFRINQEEEKIVSGIETIGIEDINPGEVTLKTCLLYTSDAADD